VGTIASSGSTIVTAKTGRFRRRLAMGAIGLVLLLLGGGVGLGVVRGNDGGGGSDAVAIPDANLPDLGSAVPVLASLSTDAPAPDPGVLTGQLTPLLTAPGLGAGVSAQVVDVASGDVLHDLDAGSALADALGAPGATVVLGEAPAGARTLATVHSAPIARLVEQALSTSDNMLAEVLARQVALARDLPASFEGAGQAVMDALADAGIDVSGVALSDGSGLSLEDRVPAGVLTAVVSGAADGSLKGASALLSGLPVAGYDGTLFDRGDAGAAPGTVRAKTGTLLGVHALAGTVVTADGRLLAFAVVADGSSGGDVAAESALDGVAAALAGCGCR
jgi:D-alanyl-D-alanine carboxypeptidase/D-alanyl-D-alanine-endopeptidase (penicillin-binding protein 4)